MNEGTQRSKHAAKRTPDQVERDRDLAVQLTNKGFTTQEIADFIKNSFGYEISRRMISTDLAVVRKRWRESQMEEFNVLMRQELYRLDTFERELWDSFRESKGTVTQKRVEEVARQVREEQEGSVDDERLVELMIDKVVTMTQDSWGDRGLLELIFKTQQERRKLLGVYAPVRHDIDIRETLDIKAYSGGISPDDWPSHEVIEGEISDAGTER